MLSRYQRGLSRYGRVWRHAMNLQTSAVASLALFGGLRRAEIRFAGIDDIHPDNDFIVVRGKSPFGERQGYREVPYTEAGRRMVGEWLAFRNLIGPSHDSPWLVLTANATPKGRLPSHPFDPIKEHSFKKLMSRVGAWELHRFRHTCATEWLRAGAELEVVQRLMGHATLDQTLCYAQLVNTDVARGLRRVESDFLTVLDRRNQRLLGGTNGRP
jgi:integrase